MRRQKKYKEIVNKAYNLACENKIVWPKWLEESLNNQEYKDYFYNKPAGSGGYYHFIKLLIKEMSPRTVLELGSHYGLGILAVMASLPQESKFITVDITKNLSGVPEKILQDDRFRFVNGNCLDLQIYANEPPKNIDLLICDTVHSYAQIKAEFELYEPLLSDEAVILVDDLDYTLEASGKRRYFNEWPQDKIDLSSYCHSSGYGALIYNKDK